MATSKIPAIKAYLVDTLLPSVVPTGVSVFWGLPLGYTERDLVIVADGLVTNEFPNYGSSSSSRNLQERGQIVIVIKSYRPLGDGGQRAATVRAFEIHDSIRDHFKATPNETLGGLVIFSSVVETSLIEDDESVDDDELNEGRLAVVTATLSFQGRS